jgi:hypothetical protein
LSVTAPSVATFGDEIAIALPPPIGEQIMPISRLLAESNLTPEQRDVIELAFADTLKRLNLMNRNDPVCEIVAKKVIEVGSRGVLNAWAISEIAYKQLDPR